MKFQPLIPELYVSSLDGSIHFYRDILGFSLAYERPEQRFAFLSMQGAQLMLQETRENPWITAPLEYPLGRGVNFQIETDDLDGIHRRLLDAGITLYRDIETARYQENETVHTERELLVQDPDGYLLRFSETV